MWTLPDSIRDRLPSIVTGLVVHQSSASLPTAGSTSLFCTFFVLNRVFSHTCYRVFFLSACKILLIMFKL